MSAAAVTYQLPASLIGRADLSRLVREVENVDNALEAQRVRSQAETGGYHLPTMSQSMSDFLELNKLDIADDQVRMALKDSLRTMKDKAPVVHMTFAIDADPEFLQQLVGWMRQEIHPQALVSVGLQPGIIGGVYMRTPNHVHDFSLKKLMGDKRSIIVDELENMRSLPVKAEA